MFTNIPSIFPVPQMFYFTPRKSQAQFLEECLSTYCLTKADMLALGYPIEIQKIPGAAIIYNHPKTSIKETQRTIIRPRQYDLKKLIQKKLLFTFKEKLIYYTYTYFFENKPNGSLSRFQEPTKYLEIRRNVKTPTNQTFSYPIFYLRVSREYPTTIPFELVYCCISCLPLNLPKTNPKTCERCKKNFYLSLNKEICRFHFGKLRNRYVLNMEKHVIENINAWTCCERSEDEEGCSTSSQHVWSGLSERINGPLTNFVKTVQRNQHNMFSKYKVFALDCEMLYTTAGLEVGKVTLVSVEGKIIYDTYVTPEHPVLDYNTKYSGLTGEIFSSGNQKNFFQVQRELINIITDDTILIGHGLNNDLRVLKILHEKVIDTSSLFPHERGYPYRHSLKNLAKNILKVNIQSTSNGHNSHEDATTAMQLVLKKVCCDFSIKLW